MVEHNLNPANAAYVEQLFREWSDDSESVPAEWREYFSTLPDAAGPPAAAGLVSPGQSSDERPSDGVVTPAQKTTSARQSRVDSLIWAYRDAGYVHADLNPLKGYGTPDLEYLFVMIEGIYESLSLEEHGLSEADLDSVFSAGRYLKPSRATLRQIVAVLRETYCGYIGAEILHIRNKPIRRWLIEKMEASAGPPGWSQEQKTEIQQDLIRAGEFERFLHSHYVGQKRFSLEGSEVLIPALHYLVNTAEKNGIQEIVLGMAHRGRLNVLTHVLGKPPFEIFSTFEDSHQPHTYGGSGDVKYHLGYSLDHRHEDGGVIHISLAPNPSHLESIDPVVEGKARGVQERRGDRNRKKVVPVLIHGDAAFTGQGVVAETLNFSGLRGYRTGGTIHVIVNNQIGFTTASRDARSTFFPTDPAKAMSIPIFHVNGDRPEHVLKAMDLALQYRQKFGFDVVVDIFCYRKYGHNEADEPSFSHPIMYKLIKNRPSAATIYGQELDGGNVYSTEDQQRFRLRYREQLAAALEKARQNPVPFQMDAFQTGEWKQFTNGYSWDPVPTRISRKTLADVGKKLTEIPAGFHVHPKLGRILGDKTGCLKTGEAIDWATAEALAFASLLTEGVPIRLSGEDCGRGTFSQRHAVWWDMSAAEPKSYIPLQHLSAGQAPFAVYDSPLSEFSVLGYEYGYALARPKILVIWEAQFGDFSNGAQVIIDQFIAAGESKWFRSNGLVMLLPHGYEGQGPEHSSAHLERYLQLCAEDNIQVCYPTLPAQFFHLLRRQMKRRFRKPLIVMTPKSLLRHKQAVSTASEFTAGAFQEALDDPSAPRGAATLVFCSGKIYYDLRQRRQELERTDVALIRLEQLYPFPVRQIAEILACYGKAKRFLWLQEEPRNRGAWHFVRDRLGGLLGDSEPAYVGRDESASPAVGSFKLHLSQLEAVMQGVFT